MPEKNVVLGIDVGSREYGYAVFKYGNYDHGRVVSLKGHKTTEEKCAAISKRLSTVILREQPCMIVWRRLIRPYQGTLRLQALENAMFLLAAHNRIPTKRYAASTIKQTCSPCQKQQTKNDICVHLSRLYPSLHQHLHPYTASASPKWKYWIHLFNAVAVVHTHQQHAKQRQQLHEHV